MRDRREVFRIHKVRRVYDRKAGKFSYNISYETHTKLTPRTIATTVLLCDGKISHPHFYGRNVRGIRRHYAWLRKRLGERKALKTIRKIKNTERRKVNAILHD